MVKRQIQSCFEDKLRYSVLYDEPDVCPLCHYAITPSHIEDEWYTDNSGSRHLAILYTCPHCFLPFVAHFIDSNPLGAVMSPHLDYCGPSIFPPQVFEDDILALSPQFVKIYNQALEAESRGLDEVAGIGYRKALEFLVKDYCKHKHPEKGDEIERSPLAKCISDYIAHPQINTLASRAAWIGNDETHYIRKLENRDVSDMKKFIDATLHYISMELAVEDAASMSPAR